MSRYRKRLVILISGRGSNMSALLEASDNGTLAADVVAVISNKPGAVGLDVARTAGIPTEVVNHQDFSSREDFDRKLYSTVSHYNPDYVALAGFMRILTSEFVAPLIGKLINIHPSLLPKYPGLNTHERAIEAGDRDAGATVHFVTEELDGGPAILHARVPILVGDTPDELSNRVLIEEHRLYPQALALLCEERIHLVDGAVLLDGDPIPKGGIALTDFGVSGKA